MGAIGIVVAMFPTVRIVVPAGTVERWLTCAYLMDVYAMEAPRYLVAHPADDGETICPFFDHGPARRLAIDSDEQYVCAVSWSGVHGTNEGRDRKKHGQSILSLHCSAPAFWSVAVVPLVRLMI